MIDWNFDSEFHNTNSQKYINATELLNLIAEFNIATPKGLARSRRRENIIRLQCQRLEKYDLLREVGHEAYEITEWGQDFISKKSLSEKVTQQTSFQYLPEKRITDFSGLDPDVCKIINREEFFEDSSNDYGLINNDRELTEKRIKNIKNSRINRLMKEFPVNAPVAAQCAHWVRALVGIHFFPDANHRTAMATLSFLLDVNDIPYPKWPGDEIERAVLKSKIIRTLLVNVRFNNLWEQDELFVHWHRHFQNLLYDVECDIDRTYSVEELKQILDSARELKRNL